ncbi:MarR family transcriptional regulator [Acetobacterium paludosum]|uniref:MarR family transcriptional regulator n=1 Tax=Acetobacterium paludosum TaxID=52693 RepID=A0A923HWL8_9FIRM|nr:MarR family transcriptional regulator [Acetobacterium paludosum]MBC3887964.1 MarR family transcriptional regulator [Acetobacterium paludosum]
MEGTSYDHEHFLFGMLFALGNRLQAIGDGFYEELTCKQWFVMAGISIFEAHPPTMNELADTIGSSHQNIKQIVLKLEKAGFVEIYRDEKDRRKTRVKRKEKSFELSQKYQQKEIEFMSALYDGIEDENLKITTATIAKMERNLIKIKNY